MQVEQKSIIPGNTGYRILEYIIRLYNEKELTAKYVTDPFIVFLLDRGYIKNASYEDRMPKSLNVKKRLMSGRVIAKYKSTPLLKDLVINDLNPLYHELRTFITVWHFDDIKNHWSIDDLHSLIKLSNVYSPLLADTNANRTGPPKLTFQEILAKYFSGSKHTSPGSNLAKAINTIVGGEKNIDLKTANQALSILYPKEPANCIILCENINRIGASRHNNIEFWYCGGRNTFQLQYIPNPKLPIYYLFDWDFDGLSIYLHIKEKYFPTLKPIIPKNYKTLAVPRDNVKYHHSKWRNDTILTKLVPLEQEIVIYLLKTDKIIEEQKINIEMIESYISEQLI